MKSSELIKTIVENNLTSSQVLNLLINDMPELYSDYLIAASQTLIQYYNGKITEVLCKVIEQLKEGAAQ